MAERFPTIGRFLNFYNLAMLVILAFFTYLVFYGFPDSPSPWFDEGINLGIAKSWVEHGVFSLQTGPSEFVQERSLLITTNYPLLAFVALFFKIFGVGLWQAKIVMILFLFAFFSLFYLLTRKYYGKNCALVSLALLVTFLPLYGNGKSVLGEIPGLTYFLGALLMLDNKKRWQIFVTGLLFGLAAATKPIFLLFVISVAISEFLLAMKNKKCDFKYWILLSCGMAIPLLVWLYTIFPNAASFHHLSDVVSFYGNPYNTTNTNVILPNLLKFFTESTPIHFTLLLSTFVFSKIVVKPRTITRVESILLVFVFLNFLFFLKTVGWYRYFFPAHILLFILFPCAFCDFARKFFDGHKLRIIIIASTFILLVAVQIVNLGFNIKNGFYYNPAPRIFAEAAGRYVKEGNVILVINVPEIGFLIKSDFVSQYLQNSPHSTVGSDLIKLSVFPDFIISSPWSENSYLMNYLENEKKYHVVLRGEKYNLYSL